MTNQALEQQLAETVELDDNGVPWWDASIVVQAFQEETKRLTPAYLKNGKPFTADFIRAYLKLNAGPNGKGTKMALPMIAALGFAKRKADAFVATQSFMVVGMRLMTAGILAVPQQKSSKVGSNVLTSQSETGDNRESEDSQNEATATTAKSRSHRRTRRAAKVVGKGETTSKQAPTPARSTRKARRHSGV